MFSMEIKVALKWISTCVSHDHCEVGVKLTSQLPERLLPCVHITNNKCFQMLYEEHNKTEPTGHWTCVSFNWFKPHRYKSKPATLRTVSGCEVVTSRRARCRRLYYIKLKFVICSKCYVRAMIYCSVDGGLASWWIVSKRFSSGVVLWCEKRQSANQMTCWWRHILFWRFRQWRCKVDRSFRVGVTLIGVERTSEIKVEGRRFIVKKLT